MSGDRHVLVIASQCRTMLPLPGLAAAAESLHDVLNDAELGGCSPGLPDGRGLYLVGPDHTGGDIYAAVRAAIAHADARRATLVLALLGHGFIPGDAATLYFMGPDAAEEVPDSGVNVGELLLEAAERSGIAGVIGIIDTCHAAAAHPDMARLSAGARHGRTSLSLLMSSAVGQEARDLRLSREVALLLRTGTAAEQHVLFAENLEEALRPRLSGQDLAVLSYSGGPRGRAELWLAANRRFHTGYGRGVVGPPGAARLAQDLAAVGRPAPMGRRWDSESLRTLRSEAAAEPWDPSWSRLEQSVDALQVSLHTRAFLRSWLSPAPTSAALRNAAAALRPGPGGRLVRIPPAAFSRVDSVVEHIALHSPGAQNGCRRWICRFVVALAQEAGRSLDAPELIAWAEQIDASVEFGDAVTGAAHRRAAGRPRLVVSLHASRTGDWPATLDGWLMDGPDVVAHEVFANRAEPDRLGTEEALAAAVDWAEANVDELELGPHLQRIEVAAPTALLLRWRPEEVVTGSRVLGVRYDLVIRWSQRLNPPAGLKWINGQATARWDRLGELGDTAPIDWLDRSITGDADALHENLRTDRYARAIGLDHAPGLDDAELLDLLLAFSPVVLWAAAPDGFPAHYQIALNEYWHTLPSGFADAYRRVLRKDLPDESGDVVARLRAVWDDLEWLRFCKSQRRRTPYARQGGPL